MISSRNWKGIPSKEMTLSLTSNTKNTTQLVRSMRRTESMDVAGSRYKFKVDKTQATDTAADKICIR